MLKLTTDRHEASHGLSATAEPLVLDYWRQQLRGTGAHAPPGACRCTLIWQFLFA